MGLDPHQRGAIFLLANEGAAKAVGWKPSDDGCPKGTCFTDDEGWKISLDPGAGAAGPTFNVYDADGNLRGNEDSFPEAALSAANKQEVPDVDPDNDGDVDLPGSTDDPDGDSDIDLDNLDVAKLIQLLGGVPVNDQGGSADGVSGPVAVVVAKDVADGGDLDDDTGAEDVDASDDAEDDDDEELAAQLNEQARAAVPDLRGMSWAAFLAQGAAPAEAPVSATEPVTESLAAETEEFASKIKGTPVLAFDQLGNVLGIVNASDIQQVQTVEPSMQNPAAAAAAPAPVPDQAAPAPLVDANGNPLPDPNAVDPSQAAPAATAPAPQAVLQPPAATPSMRSDGTMELSGNLYTFAKQQPKVDPKAQMVPVYDKDGSLVGIVDAADVQPLNNPSQPGQSTVPLGPAQAQVPSAAAAETEVLASKPDKDEDEDDSFAAMVDYWRDYTPATRAEQAKKGVALPDGSYPIANGKDLANAVKSIGRAKNPAKAKAHVIKRARALKKTDTLPANWAADIDALDRELEAYEPEQRALVASGALLAERPLAAPVEPPVAWFSNPRLSGPTALTITDEGRVFGHLATWDTCHIGALAANAGCVTAPHSKTDYSMFHLGLVKTAEGEEVPVGRLTMNTSHASEGFNPRRAIAHYENTGMAMADVHVGEDVHGIWFAGALRPDATPEHVRAFRASPLSGDWRTVPRGGMELVAALAVNMAGFPVPRPRGLVASGALMSLQAAGMVAPEKVLTSQDLSADDVLYLAELRQRNRQAAADDLKLRALSASFAVKRASFAADCPPPNAGEAESKASIATSLKKRATGAVGKAVAAQRGALSAGRSASKVHVKESPKGAKAANNDGE